jgi:hypothetical protein
MAIDSSDLVFISAALLPSSGAVRDPDAEAAVPVRRGA